MFAAFLSMGESQVVLVSDEGDHHSSEPFKWSIHRSLIMIGHCKLIFDRIKNLKNIEAGLIVLLEIF